MTIRRSSHALTRRDLVKRLGAAALALPALELFGGESRALAAPGKSKFVVFIYTPNGVNESVFWPTGAETNFQLSSVLAAFAPFKDKMLILGPQMNGTLPAAGTGVTFLQPPPQHQAPVCLTARIGTGCTGHECTVTPGGRDGYGLPYLNQGTAVNRVDGPSIDQVIAMAVQGSSPFSSLNFGMHPVGGDTPSEINYAQDGTPLQRMASADEAWNRVFGAVMPGAGGGSTAAMMQAQADLRRQAALTDLLNNRFSTLRTQVSVYDRNVIDHHLASLRTFEDRKTRLLMGQSTQQMQCLQPMRAPVPTDDASVRTGADSEQLSPFFMDMIATALSCNLTKVASVTFGYPGGGGAGGLRMPWLGFTDPLHGVSHHGGNPVLLDKYRQMNTWIAGQVAGLLQRLAAIQLPGAGSLLDQTTVFWFNRHGDGNTHANFAVPNIILGGTGGYFRMGRWLQLPATNPTKVLISIANAMGVDVPTFGQKEFADNAPLAGIAA